MADHSRTEKATARKRQQAQAKGQVLRSRELTAAATFAAGIVVFYFLSGSVTESLRETMRGYFAALADRQASPLHLLLAAVERGALLTAPLAAVAVGASLTANHLQSPIQLATEALHLDFSRISPRLSLSALFSTAGLSNLLKATVGLGALAYACWSVLEPESTTLSALSTIAPREVAMWTTGLAGRLVVRAALIFGLLAAVDYALAYYRHEESLKMTRQEVKEEYKNIEGNPEIKGRIRRAQKAMARRRMMAEVPKATLVVANPEHVAVALKYDAGEPAPRVIAKGKGELAQRIKAVARHHSVVIYEDPPLARALYPVDLGAVIPPNLYKAVAEVLAYLVKLRAVRF